MNQRVASFDGVRGVAILLVVAGHVVTNHPALSPAWRETLLMFANPGAGVRLFFVLSGYLITDLLLNELAASGTISLRGFYWRRALRILPACYVFLAVVAVIAHPKFSTLLAAGSFTWNYALLGLHPSANEHWLFGHLWTLALEQQFYLFWPLVLVLGGRRGATRIAVSLILLSPLVRVGSYFLFPDQRGYLGMMAHSAMDLPMIGCAAALVLNRSPSRQQQIDASPLYVLLAAVWLLLISPIAASQLRGFPIAAGFTLDGLAAAWIIGWLHYSTHPVGTAWLRRGALPALGLISYSLYLWQQLFLAPGGLLQTAGGIVALTAALATAIASYCFVERPALALKTRTGWFSARRPTRAHAGTP